MITLYRNFIKLFICISFILSGVNVHAQTALLLNTIDKIESYKNFSYHSVNKKKELLAIDTLTERYNSIFVKDLSDKNFGYSFNFQTLTEDNKVDHAELYNGHQLVYISPRDSTYSEQNSMAINAYNTLPVYLKWLHGRLEKKSTKVTKVNDTTINRADCYHIIINVYDTIINKERNYSYADFYIDKLSGLPNQTINRSRYTTYGNGVSTYYSASSYADYKFDQNDVDTVSFTRPKYYHQPAVVPILSALTSGTTAPDWSLNDTEGKKMSLTQMKGKVILLDFFFIGCFPCMESLPLLDSLHKKYRNQNFVIASISTRDSNKQVKAFKETYHINYPMYGNAAEVAKLYHINGAPTFYFIDQQGKITSFRDGYDVDFVKKMSTEIELLLKKQ